MTTNDGSRVVVRCDKNMYRTPLFSFDAKGIYFKCKDCRTLDESGAVKRGTYHLFPWSEILKMAVGLYEELKVEDGGSDSSGGTAGDSVANEESTEPCCNSGQ